MVGLIEVVAAVVVAAGAVDVAVVEATGAPVVVETGEVVEVGALVDEQAAKTALTLPAEDQ